MLLTKYLVLIVCGVVALSDFINAERFPLSIIHINDFHARYEESDQNGGSCDPSKQCIGGYARTVYTVKRLLHEQKDKNPVYFNSGDSFQGTLWYNIGTWNVTYQFLNLLPADAMTLGNHEFDHDIKGVVPFLERINTTMLVANMDASEEPTMQGKYQNSTIIERSGRKIGVIGVILEKTNEMARTGKLIFHNESDAVRVEAQKLKAAGANIIIVLSHCGYDVDKIIAKNAGDHIDVIVGAHSHTFLYTGDNYPGPEKPAGPYPTEVFHQNGHRILIVQASAYARYVGNITVYFDDNGDVIDYEGAPIYMNASVPEDDEVKAALVPWKEIVDTVGNVVIGETKVDLTKNDCFLGECNLGNFFTDAMIYAIASITPMSNAQNVWSYASIALVNTGGLRVPIYAGNITYSMMVTMSPFNNTLVAFNLRGDKLIEAFETAVQSIDPSQSIYMSYTYLQISGLKVTYNYSNPVGKRVVGIKVLCNNCTVPRYTDLDRNKVYRIVAPSFLQEGGDGFYVFKLYGTDVYEAMTDLDALDSYIRHVSPIYTGIEGRYTILK